MYHVTRWTAEKIEQRIQLLETLIYRRKSDLAPFRLHIAPDTEADTPLVSPDMDDSSWAVVEPSTYWGDWCSNFTLRGTFQCPADNLLGLAIDVRVGGVDKVDAYIYCPPDEFC